TPPLLIEYLQAVRPCLPAVDDDGPLGSTRLLELPAKHSSLYVAGRMIVVIVESDFAPRDHARMPSQPVEFGVMRISRVPCLVRMDSHRSIDPLMLLGIRNRSPELFKFRPVSDRQQGPNARCLRPIEHRIAVCIEVGNIHMCMRID